MKVEQYMMAKAWMKQDKATPEEAIETWNKREAEFNEERLLPICVTARSQNRFQ